MTENVFKCFSILYILSKIVHAGPFTTSLMIGTKGHSDSEEAIKMFSNMLIFQTVLPLVGIFNETYILTQ